MVCWPCHGYSENKEAKVGRLDPELTYKMFNSSSQPFFACRNSVITEIACEFLSSTVVTLSTHTADWPLSVSQLEGLSPPLTI